MIGSNTTQHHVQVFALLHQRCSLRQRQVSPPLFLQGIHSFAFQLRSRRPRFAQYLPSSRILMMLIAILYNLHISFSSYSLRICNEHLYEFRLRNLCLVVCYVLIFQVVTQNLLTSNLRRDCGSCSTGKFDLDSLCFLIFYFSTLIKF